MVRPTQQASAGEIFLRLGELEARGPANLAWCLGSLGRRGVPSLAALSGAFTRRSRAEHGPQEPGTVAWCPATLATAGSPLFGFVGELAQRLDLRESQPQNLTNILWNPGTLVLAKQTSCDALVAAAAGKMRELHAQNISNRAWSLATLVAGPRLASEPAFGATSAEAIRQLPAFGPQATANSAWAFAASGHRGVALLGASAAAACLAELSQQQPANLAWASATAAAYSLALPGAIAESVVQKIAEMSPQGLANAAWSLCKLGMRSQPPMEAPAAEAAERIGASDPQNLSNVAWTFGKPGMTQEPLLDATSWRATCLALGPRELAGLAWALATLRRYGAASSAVLGHGTVLASTQFQALDAANAAWGFAAAAAQGVEVAAALATAARAKQLELDIQPLAALVDLDLPGCEDLQRILTERVDIFAMTWLKEDAFSPSNHILQEWQVNNVGIHGTTRLLSKCGIVQPTLETGFVQRALASMSELEASRVADWRKERFFFKARVYCYLEYELRHDAKVIQGSLMKENSFLGEGTRAGRAGLLKHWVLPISELVDRSLCAEFQALSELCDRLDALDVKPEERCDLPGVVRLWTLGASCLSCVRAMRQFRQLFPTLRLEVHCDERLAQSTQASAENKPWSFLIASRLCESMQ
ncbi:unnamed protein product [Effrenium voratum]|nr:unnamed protein product [Effrenium voratum]